MVIFLIMKKIVNQNNTMQYNVFFPIKRQFFLLKTLHTELKKKDNYSFRFKTSDSNSRIYFSLRSDKNK